MTRYVYLLASKIDLPLFEVDLSHFRVFKKSLGGEYLSLTILLFNVSYKLLGSVRT